MTLLLTILAATQLLTMLGLAYAALRLRSLSAATVRSDADSALIGAVEELLLELEDQTLKAMGELMRQRAEIDALLRESELQGSAEAAREPTKRRKASRQPASSQTDGPNGERRQRAIDLRDSGYADREIARELRVSTDEVRLLLATASAQLEGA